jgi:hypothetical protein
MLSLVLFPLDSTETAFCANRAQIVGALGRDYDRQKQGQCVSSRDKISVAVSVAVVGAADAVAVGAGCAVSVGVVGAVPSRQEQRQQFVSAVPNFWVFQCGDHNHHMGFAH